MTNSTNNRLFSKGDKVRIGTKKEGMVTGTVSHYTPSGVVYIHGDNNKAYERVEDKVELISRATSDFVVDGESQNNNRPNVNDKFDINKRFDFLESLVRMVLKGKRKSLIVTGPGGLGKTHTVEDQLRKAGLTSDWDMELTPEEIADYEGETLPYDFKFVKGYSTPKGLYNTLYENRDKLVIYDDCDEVLKNDVAKNILKGALDSYSKRIVNWVRQSFADGIPSQFEFTGQIIFISNLTKNKIDQAILSRASNVDLTMSVEDKLERMHYIMEQKSFCPDATMEEKEEAFELLEEHAHGTDNLNLRTLIEMIDYRISGEENWKELSEYVLYS